MPNVHRTISSESWLTNRIVDVSIDGTQLAYLSYRNNTSNIFIKDNRILMVGSNILMNGTSQYANTDIFVCRTDGTQLTQLTYHAADDLTPVWSRDGKYIYFISQRGSATAVANVWRMNFVL